MTRGNFDKPDRFSQGNDGLPIKVTVSQGRAQLFALQDNSSGNLMTGQLTGLINQRQVGNHLIKFKTAAGREQHLWRRIINSGCQLFCRKPTEND